MIISIVTLNFLQEYTAKQMNSLVTVGVGSRSGKKSRQRLFSVVDEVDRHH